MPGRKRARAADDDVEARIAAARADALREANEAAAAAAAAAKIATEREKEKGRKERENSWICAVCTDIMSSPATLPCGHSFCLGCVRAALSVREECPACRAKASKTLPLAVNTIVRAMIADNDGPAYRERQRL